MHFKFLQDQLFSQLSGSIDQLSAEAYQRPCITLNASIGQHTRHIIEGYISLLNGYAGGLVNYENRKRDIRTQTDKDYALGLMSRIIQQLEKDDKELQLHAGPAADDELVCTVKTNYYREIIYNIEHCVHHMALIRIGINEVSDITLPEDFGVASSTIKYRRSCAQ